MEALSLCPTVFEAGRCTCNFISAKFVIFKNFQKNIDSLKKDMEKLKALKDGFKERLDLAEKEGKVPLFEVKEWIKAVEALELQVNSLEAEITEKERKLHGCSQNCRLKYNLSRRALEKSQEIKEIINNGNFTTLVAMDAAAKAVEQIPAPSVVGQKAANEILDQLLRILTDDKVGRIGVWGMGGVGKTTLVKNLNNKLKSCPIAQPFDMVIWVTVSKDLDLRKIQSRVAERLNLPLQASESTEQRAVRLFERLNREKKFLLILDDVWERIDLDVVGIPQLEDHPGCRTILTTRSLEVCRVMRTETEIKVNVLSDEEAWSMFGSNASEVVELNHIKPLALAVSRECSGLPLAIITVGRAMRGKTKAELWSDALSELRKSVPHIKGIEKEVFLPLKWSYDSLEGKNVKPCFLFCCLFPEDFSIDVNELIQCWMAEGFLDKQQDLEESQNRGIAIIEDLKDCCLLEKGAQEDTVRMHDVVRDVAIWIGSSSADGSKFLVRSGMGLTQIPNVGLWSSLAHASFVNNRITKLPEHRLQSSKLSSLLLQGNIHLAKIPEELLDGFKSLKVLNLSDTRIQSLPNSLVQLSQLRALFLKNCFSLEELPLVSGLRKLEILDLGNTRLSELPPGFENLRCLRQLNLSNTHNLEFIKEGTFSKLQSLEQLDMSKSAFVWYLKERVPQGMASFEELGSLDCLSEVYVRLANRMCLFKDQCRWVKRLRKFNIFVGPCDYTNIPSGTYDQKMVAVGGLDPHRCDLQELFSNTSTLVLDNCPGVIEGFEEYAASGVDFTCLKSLTMSNCFASGTEKGSLAHCCNLLPNLEEFNIYNFPLKSSMSTLMQSCGLNFSRLRKLHVVDFKCTIALIHHGVIQQLENLEELRVNFCDCITVFLANSTITIQKLRVLELKNLNRLQRICSRTVQFPSLERFEVRNCPNLVDLSFSDQSLPMIKEIWGEEQWWDQLQWKNDIVKLSLQPLFRPRKMP